MFPTLLRRSREPLSKVTSSILGSSTTTTAASTPFKARKVWPPNLENLTPQQQLRFEKKYKRRVVLAQQAPRWQKGVKYAQFATLTAALVYMIFFAEFEWYGKRYVPLDEIRHSFNTIFGVFDNEKRHERPRSAPAPPQSKDDK